jgi:hypothetical protein
VQVLGAADPRTVSMYVAPAPIHGPVDSPAPNPPTAVTAVGGDASAVVSWTAAIDGGPVSGFVVESSPGDVTCVAWGALATSCTVSPLTNGTSYTFRVKAVGEGGFSSPSAPSNPVIPSLCGPPPAPGPFSDVGGTHPFCSDIEWLADSGVTAGFPDGTFRPVADVTRQSTAAFLYRYSGSPAFIPPATPTFPDVPASHLFYLEIEWLASTGITGGFADGTYRPGSTVNRQSMAAFMYRLAGEPAFTPPATPSFTDVGTAHPFYDEIEWFVDTGITTGFPDDTYRPGGPVTRQEYAAFQHRYDQLP